MVVNVSKYRKREVDLVLLQKNEEQFVNKESGIWDSVKGDDGFFDLLSGKRVDASLNMMKNGYRGDSFIRFIKGINKRYKHNFMDRIEISSVFEALITENAVEAATWLGFLDYSFVQIITRLIPDVFVNAWLNDDPQSVRSRLPEKLIAHEKLRRDLSYINDELLFPQVDKQLQHMDARLRMNFGVSLSKFGINSTFEELERLYPRNLVTFDSVQKDGDSRIVSKFNDREYQWKTRLNCDLAVDLYLDSGEFLFAEMVTKIENRLTQTIPIVGIVKHQVRQCVVSVVKRKLTDCFFENKVDPTVISPIELKKIGNDAMRFLSNQDLYGAALKEIYQEVNTLAYETCLNVIRVNYNELPKTSVRLLNCHKNKWGVMVAAGCVTFEDSVLLISKQTHYVGLYFKCVGAFKLWGSVKEDLTSSGLSEVGGDRLDSSVALMGKAIEIIDRELREKNISSQVRKEVTEGLISEGVISLKVALARLGETKGDQITDELVLSWYKEALPNFTFNHLSGDYMELMNA